MNRFIILIPIINLMIFYQSISQIKLDTVSRTEVNHFCINSGTNYYGTSNDFAFVLGFSYEYQYQNNFGIGLSGTVLFLDKTEYKLEIPIYYHPYKNYWLQFSPGLAYTRTISYSIITPDVVELPDVINDKLTGNFFFGIGAGYDFDLSEANPRFSITPYLNCDYINLEHIYLGVGLRMKLKLSNAKVIKKTKR